MNKVYYKFQDQSNNEKGFLFQTADETQNISLDTLYSFNFDDVKFTYNGTTHESGEFYGREYESEDGEKIIRFKPTDIMNNGYWVNELGDSIAPCRDCLLENISKGSFTDFETNPVVETENGRIFLNEDGEWGTTERLGIITEPDKNPALTGSIGEVQTFTHRGNWHHGIRTFSEKIAQVTEFGQQAVFDRGDVILFVGKSLEYFRNIDSDITNISELDEDGKLVCNSDEVFNVFMSQNAPYLNQYSKWSKPAFTNANEHQWTIPFISQWKLRTNRSVLVASQQYLENYGQLTSEVITELFNSLDIVNGNLMADYIQHRIGAVVLNLDDPEVALTQTQFDEIINNFRTTFGKPELPIIHTTTPSVESYRLDAKQDIVNMDEVDIYDYNEPVQYDIDVKYLKVHYYTAENGWDIVPDSRYDYAEVEGFDEDVITRFKIEFWAPNFSNLYRSEVQYFTILPYSEDEIANLSYVQTPYGKLPKNAHYCNKLLVDHNQDVEDFVQKVQTEDDALFNYNQDENNRYSIMKLYEWDGNIIFNHYFRRLYRYAITWVSGGGSETKWYIRDEFLRDDVLKMSTDFVDPARVGELTLKGKDQLARKWAYITQPHVLKLLNLWDYGVKAHYSAESGIKLSDNGVVKWENLSVHGSAYDLTLVQNRKFVDVHGQIHDMKFTEPAPIFKQDKWGGMATIEFWQNGLPNAMLANNNPLISESYITSSKGASGDISVDIQDYEIFFMYAVQGRTTNDFTENAPDGQTIMFVNNSRSQHHCRLLCHAPWTKNGRCFLYNETAGHGGPWSPVFTDNDFGFYGEKILLRLKYKKGVGAFIYKNGVLLKTGSIASNHVLKCSRHAIFQIGGDIVHHQSMDLSEVAIFTNDLTNQQAQAIEGYLCHKWGLTNVLPQDHPYKFTSP